jgi:hypothetical protein
MKVIKRSGQSAPIKFDQITTRISNLTKGLSKGVDATKIAQQVSSSIYDGISTQEIDSLSAEIPEIDSLFGTSVAQSAQGSALLVGAPAAASGAGAVYTYLQRSQTDYAENIELLLTATGTQGFGNSVDFGNQIWAVAGASASNSGAGYAVILYLVPGSNSYQETQLLVAPDQDFSAIGFGSAVKISSDERWIYVSAPGANQVYAYNRVDVPEQFVTYVTNGTQATFVYNNDITVDSFYPEQLSVTLNSQWSS